MAQGTPQTVVKTAANQVTESWMNIHTNRMQIANAVQDATTHTFGYPYLWMSPEKHECLSKRPGWIAQSQFPMIVSHITIAMAESLSL